MTSLCFQSGEGFSRGILHNCETLIFVKVRLKLYRAVNSNNNSPARIVTRRESFSFLLNCTLIIISLDRDRNHALYHHYTTLELRHWTNVRKAVSFSPWVQSIQFKYFISNNTVQSTGPKYSSSINVCSFSECSSTALGVPLSPHKHPDILTLSTSADTTIVMISTWRALATCHVMSCHVMPQQLQGRSRYNDQCPEQLQAAELLHAATWAPQNI